MTNVRELRLRYSIDSMTRLLMLLDNMKLGELPDEVAMFIAHASNAANWHELEESR